MSSPTTPPRPQSHQEFGLTRLNSRHPAIRRLKRQGGPNSLHGNKVWGANHLLIDYLQHHPLPAQSRVMELGCGWGLAGIYCAKNFSAEVVGVDADPEVFPYLHLHAELNGVTIEEQVARFETISDEQLANIDVLIGADICFWDEMTEAVWQLIERAVDAGVKKIVIADPERPPFFALAEACIDEFYAELEPRQITTPKRASGALLVIENA